MFQSTRPRGARPLSAFGPGTQICFNPRAHVGRDKYLQYRKSTIASFNPRAHVGRDFSLDYRPEHKLGFNPRAHVGRDRLTFSIDQSPFVSIHAPTWGATPLVGRES